jgi:hypothetical protein
MGPPRTRSRRPADQHYYSAYLFGAICPVRGVGIALAHPFADTEPCDSISRKSPAMSPRAPTPCCCSTAPGGTPPPNSTCPATSRRIFLPSHAPKLNPVENVWQFMRGNWLLNLVFDTYDDIINAAYGAWLELIAKPETITSIGM